MDTELLKKDMNNPREIGDWLLTRYGIDTLITTVERKNLDGGIHDLLMDGILSIRVAEDEEE